MEKPTIRTVSRLHTAMSVYFVAEVDAYIAHLEQRAEAAEAKLAELEKQEPYGYVHNLVNPPGSGVAASIFKEESRHYGRPVFTRPSPAINLAELVPEQSLNGQAQFLGDKEPYYNRGWNDCRAAILRKLEEAQ